MWIKIQCIHFLKKKYACICFIPFTCNAGLKYHCVNDNNRRKFQKNLGNLAPLFDGDFIHFILISSDQYET